MNHTVSTEIKKMVLRDAYPGYYDLKTTEFTPYHTDVRFDVFGIRRARRESRIVEVKSSRADFLSDKKWEGYLPFATHFYFAAPEGVIVPSELPDKVGLIEIITYKNGYVGCKYTKLCKKLPPLGEQNYIKIIEGAFVRLRIELEKTEAGSHDA